MEPIPYLNETKKLKQADELKSQWVLFHNNKKYLLPQISLGQKFMPVFGDDGSIKLEIHETNPELAPLIHRVMAIAGSVQRNDASVDVNEAGGLDVTPTVYSDFIALVRALLLVNYNFTNDDLRAVLTCDPKQFSKLFGAILKHISTR